MMNYEEKAKELNDKTDGMLELALGLHSLCWDADKEISELQTKINEFEIERVEIRKSVQNLSLYLQVEAY